MISTTQHPGSPMRDVDRPRFHIGLFDGHPELRIPAGWPGMKAMAALLVALPVWIVVATFKFGAKIVFAGWTGLMLVCAIATCVFVAYAILQILWWLGGAERIAVIGQDLLVRHTLLGMALVTRSYRGEDIRFLAAVDVPRTGWLTEPRLPFASSGRSGPVKFFYHEATVYLGHDLDLTDGRRAIAWLAQRLPATAC